MRLAIPAHRRRAGRDPCLRSQSAAPALSSCNSRRSLHRQHRVQRLSDQKLVINGVEQFCTNRNIDLTSAPALSRCRTLCLRRSYSLFFVNRAAFLTTSQTPRAAKIASFALRFATALPDDF